MFAILIALSISISGGWQTIPVDSEQVKRVIPYLDRNLPLLFPEIKQGKYTIASAELQIVEGINLQLIIKDQGSPLLFQLSLYVDLKNKTTITEITRPLGSRPTVGGFNWQSTARFSQNDYLRLIRTIQRKVNLLISKKGTVLVYRIQVVNGMNIHVIIKDSNQNVFSVIASKRLHGASDELISVHQII